MKYRLLVIGGFIVAQAFNRGWYTLSKSKAASVDGLAIWTNTAANRKRAEKLFGGAPYQTVEASRLWEAHRTVHGWHACNGTDYLPDAYASQKEAIQALAGLVA